LDHPALGPRLIACAEGAPAVGGRTANQIFGSPDDRKLRSSATPFAAVSPSASVFERLLDAFYQGKRDEKTIQRLGGS
jgi:uncharacterized protein (DUF1810 family)